MAIRKPDPQKRFPFLRNDFHGYTPGLYSADHIHHMLNQQGGLPYEVSTFSENTSRALKEAFESVETLLEHPPALGLFSMRTWDGPDVFSCTALDIFRGITSRMPYLGWIGWIELDIAVYSLDTKWLQWRRMAFLSEIEARSSSDHLDLIRAQLLESARGYGRSSCQVIIRMRGDLNKVLHERICHGETARMSSGPTMYIAF